jgi:hypothetical protein
MVGARQFRWKLCEALTKSTRQVGQHRNAIYLAATAPAATAAKAFIHYHRLNNQLSAKSELSPSCYQLRHAAAGAVATLLQPLRPLGAISQVYSLSLNQQSQSYQVWRSR